MSSMYMDVETEVKDQQEINVMVLKNDKHKMKK